MGALAYIDGFLSGLDGKESAYIDNVIPTAWMPVSSSELFDETRVLLHNSANHEYLTGKLPNS